MKSEKPLVCIIARSMDVNQELGMVHVRYAENPFCIHVNSPFLLREKKEGATASGKYEGKVLDLIEVLDEMID